MFTVKGSFTRMQNDFLKKNKIKNTFQHECLENYFFQVCLGLYGVGLGTTTAVSIANITSPWRMKKYKNEGEYLQTFKTYPKSYLGLSFLKGVWLGAIWPFFCYEVFLDPDSDSNKFCILGYSGECKVRIADYEPVIIKNGKLVLEPSKDP